MLFCEDGMQEVGRVLGYWRQVWAATPLCLPSPQPQRQPAGPTWRSIAGRHMGQITASLGVAMRVQDTKPQRLTFEYSKVYLGNG
jgi:hypothetical protein